MLRLLKFNLHHPPGDGVIRPISRMNILRFRNIRSLALIAPSCGMEPGFQSRRSSEWRHWMERVTVPHILKVFQ